MAKVPFLVAAAGIELRSPALADGVSRHFDPRGPRGAGSSGGTRQPMAADTPWRVVEDEGPSAGAASGWCPRVEQAHTQVFEVANVTGGEGGFAGE